MSWRNSSWGLSTSEDDGTEDHAQSSSDAMEDYIASSDDNTSAVVQRLTFNETTTEGNATAANANVNSNCEASKSSAFNTNMDNDSSQESPLRLGPGHKPRVRVIESPTRSYKVTKLVPRRSTKKLRSPSPSFEDPELADNELDDEETMPPAPIKRKSRQERELGAQRRADQIKAYNQSELTQLRAQRRLGRELRQSPQRASRKVRFDLEPPQHKTTTGPG